VEVAPGAVVGREVAGAVEGQAGLRRGCEVGGAADDPGHVLRHCVQRLPRRVPARDALVVRRERRERCVPVVRQLAALDALELVGELGEGRTVFLEARLPRLAGLPAASADALGEVLDDAVRHEEVRVLGPAVEALRLLDALGPSGSPCAFGVSSTGVP
jgi:hypothetical protein